jgi:S-adenosylmethionine synthetase
VIDKIGYNNPSMGFDAKSCSVISAIGKQSDDISQGVDKESKEQQGAGDQGLMFGYACKESPTYMPAPIYYAHKLMKRHADVRSMSEFDWVYPDAKSQITFVYVNDRPVAIDTIVLSTQHADRATNKQIEEMVHEEIIKKTIPAKFLTKNTKYHINPTGRFVIGGPVGDCGLTGRKIIVDTYGGMARHGGGCFSGKDPSKVDRSGAYAARFIAKNVVMAGVAEKCEIQLSYAIGVREPVSVRVDTFGTSKLPESVIEKRIMEHFDLTPFGIEKKLDLLSQFYLPTAAYGHFGREDVEFSWEAGDEAFIAMFDHQKAEA